MILYKICCRPIVLILNKDYHCGIYYPEYCTLKIKSVRNYNTILLVIREKSVNFVVQITKYPHNVQR